MKKPVEVVELSLKDSEDVKAIWRECFTDDELYIKEFIEKAYSNSRSWGVVINSIKQEATESSQSVAATALHQSRKVVSMATLLPSYCKLKDGEVLKGGYLYGVGTLQNFRGRGYSTKIVNEIFKQVKSEGGDYIVCRPATPSLYTLYKKIGFNKTLHSYKLRSTPTPLVIDNRPPTLKSNATASFEKLLAAYRNSGDEHFLWNDAIAQYGVEEAIEREGGFIVSGTFSLIYYPLEESRVLLPFSTIKSLAQLESATELVAANLLTDTLQAADLLNETNFKTLSLSLELVSENKANFEKEERWESLREELKLEGEIVENGVMRLLSQKALNNEAELLTKIIALPIE